MVDADSMSIMNLLAGAHIVVQLIMLLLLVASVVSWFMIIKRYRVLGRAEKFGMAFEDRFWESDDLSNLYKQAKSEGTEDSGTQAIFCAGFEEFVRLTRAGRTEGAIMDGTQRAMRVAMQREQNRLTQNLPFLATVGSTSPYVGLLATVWGIMNSFRALASVSQATLSVVAPGIAEALIATAVGLFAAIPAVVAYNRFSAQSERILTEYEMFAEEFYAVLHRQAHERQ